MQRERGKGGGHWTLDRKGRWQVIEQALYKMWDETHGGRSEAQFIVLDSRDKVDVPARK
jgi:hypothetical protein